MTALMPGQKLRHEACFLVSSSLHQPNQIPRFQRLHLSSLLLGGSRKGTTRSSMVFNLYIASPTCSTILGFRVLQRKAGHYGGYHTKPWIPVQDGENHKEGAGTLHNMGHSTTGDPPSNMDLCHLRHLRRHLRHLRRHLRHLRRHLRHQHHVLGEKWWFKTSRGDWCLEIPKKISRVLGLGEMDMTSQSPASSDCLLCLCDLASGGMRVL
jgi:hypothetical protein